MGKRFTAIGLTVAFSAGAALLGGSMLVSSGSQAPGAPDGDRTAATATRRDENDGDPAIRFERAVVRLLESPSAPAVSGGPRGDDRTRSVAAAASIQTVAAPAGRRRPSKQRMAEGARARQEAIRRRLKSDPAVDWAYLEDVYAGRVSGIPSESRAGATLQEIDAAGEVPYFEELRESGDRAALSDLELPERSNLPICHMVSGEQLPVCTVP